MSPSPAPHRPKPAPRERICPLLVEALSLARLRLYAEGTPGRERVVAFVRRVFRDAYGAEVRELAAELIAFETADAQLGGVAGLRPASAGPLFSEVYLDAPVETLITARTGQRVQREDIVEVGNLALPGSGEARCVMAALAAYLHRAGYRWIVVTAVAPLYNGFRRMGFEPIVLGDADPARLGSDATRWGAYYAQHPRVCLGSIAAGYEQVRRAVSVGSPALRRLWMLASRAGQASLSGQPAAIDLPA